MEDGTRVQYIHVYLTYLVRYFPTLTEKNFPGWASTW